ncbi:hypothetical protein HK101_002956, partial [Irineochytrium annulatum]
SATGAPPQEGERPHYVVERTDKERFGKMLVKGQMLYHHFPNKYENALWQAHDYLLERESRGKGKGGV